MDQVLLRRILGTASLVLVLGLGYLGLDYRYAPASDSFTVEAILGDAGSGLDDGSDVKVRGVRVGSVEALTYEEATATAKLRIDPEYRDLLPGPEDIELLVTAKTLLGEKQVELRFPDEAYGQPPYLSPGDVLTAARPPTELQEVLAELEPFLDAIGPQDLADIVEALGQQRGEGPAVAENLDLGQRLSEFGARTADDQLDRLQKFSDVVAALEPAADDLNRLNDALPRAASFLPDNQAAVRTNLDALSAFATTFARFLEVEEDTIARLLITSDLVGVVFDRNADAIGSLIEGIYVYTERLGYHGGDLSDGTEYAGFRVFLHESGLRFMEDLCAVFPQAPACQEGGH